MSRRTILSRPRTRVYDSNFNIGESYYKSAIDRLDRKYSGRPSTPSRQAPALPEDLLERHERVFGDEDLSTARRRAEKVISEDTLFDSRGAKTSASGRALSAALESMDVDFDEETAAALKRIRAIKQANQQQRAEMNDIDMESTHNNIKSRRILERADKMLDAVGITDSSRRALEEDVYVKRRSMRMAQEEEQEADAGRMTKWTALREREASEDDGGAILRARKTRARLNDLEDEIEAVSERKAQRERRAANLRAFMAENELENEQQQRSAVKSVRVSSRTEKKTVTF